MEIKAKAIIHLPIKDLERAISFYKRVFGAKVNMRASGQYKGWWASLQVGQVELWLDKPSKDFTPLKWQALTFLTKGNIDDIYLSFKRRKVRVGKLFKMDYGKHFDFKDSEGNTGMIFVM